MEGDFSERAEAISVYVFTFPIPLLWPKRISPTYRNGGVTGNKHENCCFLLKQLVMATCWNFPPSYSLGGLSADISHLGKVSTKPKEKAAAGLYLPAKTHATASVVRAHGSHCP